MKPEPFKLPLPQPTDIINLYAYEINPFIYQMQPGLNYELQHRRSTIQIFESFHDKTSSKYEMVVSLRHKLYKKNFDCTDRELKMLLTIAESLDPYEKTTNKKSMHWEDIPGIYYHLIILSK